MNALLLLLFLAIIVILWQVSLKYRETAIQRTTAICRELELQLLDETVSLSTLSLGKQNGLIKLRPTYGFEFSIDGVSRYRGFIELQGNNMIHAQLEHPSGRIILPDSLTKIH